MQDNKFPDFESPQSNWYQFLKCLDGYFGQLTGNEFKVLAYIMCKTWEFGKTEDKISYNQFLQDGIGMTKKLLLLPSID